MKREKKIKKVKILRDDVYRPRPPKWIDTTNKWKLYPENY